MNVYLEVMNGAHRGRRIALPHGEFVVGRSAECHLRPASAAVSKRHCSLLAEAGRLSVRDLGSVNGTKVNSCRVEGDEFELHQGDVLEVGPLTFQVHVDERRSEPMDEDAIAALLRESPEERPADTVVDALTDKPTALDLPGTAGERTPYRSGAKSGEEKAPANTAQAARELLEQYKRRRKS
jgi:predicted component of type VI protein secretion system